MLFSNMTVVADTANFMMAFPDGINNVWNSGFQQPFNSGVDDVGYISSLIQYLGTQYNIDPAKVYSCGMSNGGFQSFRLACELEDKIAAIASVTGSMADSVGHYCQTNKSVPLLQIFGDADPTVDYNGLPFGYRGQDSLIAWWRDKNNCGALSASDTFPDIDTTDDSRVVYYQYNNCDNGSEVWFYKVLNGGHSWPGSPINVGTTNHDIQAGDEIWKFFRRHSHPNPATSISEIDKPELAIMFQNPFSGDFKLTSLSEEALRADVYDLTGRQLYSNELLAGENSLETSQLTNGIYILVIHRGNYSYNYQILKQ